MKSQFKFVNVIFYVIFGVLCGVLWAYGSPIPLIPGSVQLRLFAFLAPAIGILFGPISGFFAGYLGTVVWALISWQLHPRPHPAGGRHFCWPVCGFALRSWSPMAYSSRTFPSKISLFSSASAWSVLGGALMILLTSISLSFFTGLNYWFCVVWIGIADIAPLILVPFVVMLLAPRLDRLQTIIPRS